MSDERLDLGQTVDALWATIESRRDADPDCRTPRSSSAGTRTSSSRRSARSPARSSWPPRTPTPTPALRDGRPGLPPARGHGARGADAETSPTSSRRASSSAVGPPTRRAASPRGHPDARRRSRCGTASTRTGSASPASSCCSWSRRSWSSTRCSSCWAGCSCCSSAGRRRACCNFVGSPERRCSRLVRSRGRCSRSPAPRSGCCRRLGATLVPKGELLDTKFALKDMAIAAGAAVAPALYLIDTST